MKSFRIHRTLSCIAACLLLTACGKEEGGKTLAGDAARGKELYEQCAGCHQLAANSTGPMHCGLLGRAAGSVPGFDYSAAMKDSGLVWDAATLDEFLTSPISYVPGTLMGFVGFSEASDRADVIAYLQQANNDPTVCAP